MIYRILNKFRKTKTLHIIGDSHVEPLTEIKYSLNKVEVSLCCVQGATASGLKNPHSQTMAGPIFSEYINTKIEKNDWVLIHLGEVDCGFLIWVKMDREGIEMEEQINYTLENYFQLLKQIQQKTKNIVVLSIVPQTIKDGVKIGNVANLRGQIKATQLERTKLGQQMNLRLKEFCKFNKMYFLSLDEELIDSTTGIIRDKYLNNNPENHHLNEDKHLQLLSKLLKNIMKT